MEKVWECCGNGTKLGETRREAMMSRYAMEKGRKEKNAEQSRVKEKARE